MFKIQDIEPNTPEWLAYRLAHFNASDAAAMMNCSPHKTRDQLIHEIYIGGKVEETDRFTQRLYDRGHAVEAVALPAACAIAGVDFAPVVASNDVLSASYDGLDFMETIAWENKNLSAELRRVLSVPGVTGADLPLMYQVQMEHQDAVCETIERTLFTGSELLPDGTLGDVLHCWYMPNLELRSEILAGWKQLEADVLAYVPVESVEKAVARVMVDLPVPAVEVRGEITLTSDLAKYETLARTFIDSIPAKPENDQEFADTKEGAKKLRDAAKRVRINSDGVLARITAVGEFTRASGALADLMDAAALRFEKVVTAQEKAVREKICLEGKIALDDHVQELNDSLGRIYLRNIAADFASAIKGKRTIESVQNAKNSALAEAKKAATKIATTVRKNLDFLEAEAKGFETLFPDLATLALKPAEDFEAMARFRVVEQQARDRKAAEDLAEKDRARIRTEETIRANKEAADRAEADRLALIAAAPPPAPPAPPPVPAPVAAAPAVVAPAPTRAPTFVRQAAVIERQDDISRFLATRRWDKGQEQFARAVLVEFEKFRADQRQPLAA